MSRENKVTSKIGLWLQKQLDYDEAICGDYYCDPDEWTGVGGLFDIIKQSGCAEHFFASLNNIMSVNHIDHSDFMDYLTVDVYMWAEALYDTISDME